MVSIDAKAANVFVAHLLEELEGEGVRAPSDKSAPVVESKEERITDLRDVVRRLFNVIEAQGNRP